MPVLQLGPADGLYYEWESAREADGLTFVFVNAITGDLGIWEARIAPALRGDGHGTLAYNFRGQANSPVAAERRLSDALILEDLMTLLQQLRPSRPVLVGQSIGGLFAARACLAGIPCAGLVLINTLGHMGPRLDRLHETMLPAEADDTPPAPESGTARLIDAMAEADWSLDYGRLTVPVLILSGLQDRAFHDPVDVAMLARTIPDHRRVDLPEAGHRPPVEAPETVLAALRGFAAELAG